MKIQVVKNLNGTLKPAYDSDYESFKKIPLNEIIEIEYKKQRNIKFHRKFFSLLNVVVSNTDSFHDINHLRKVLCLVCGYYEDLINPKTGEITLIPKSISFSNMDEIEFSEFYSKCIDYCCSVLCVDKEELNNAILQNF